MIQPICQRAYTLPSTGTDWTAFIGTISVRSVEAQAFTVWDTPGAFRNGLMEIGTAPGVGKTLTLTVRNNFSDTAMVFTFSGTATTAQALTPFTVARGDLLSMRWVFSSGAAAPGSMTMSVEFVGDNAGESGYGQVCGFADAATRLSGALWSAHQTSSLDTWNDTLTAAQIENIFPTDGAITGRALATGSAPGMGKHYRTTIVLNGVLQDGSGGTVDTRTTVADLATVALSSFTLPTVATDKAYAILTSSGTPATMQVSAATTFTADIDGEAIVGGSCVGQMPNDPSPSWYGSVVGQISGFGSSEAIKTHIGTVTPFTLSKLHFHLDSSPGTGNSYDFVLRKNGGATAIAFSIDNAETLVIDLVNTAAISDGDTWNWKYDAVSFPNQPVTENWAMVTTVSVNLPPSVNAGPDQTIQIGDSIVLAGSASDFDGPDPLATEWTLQSGPGTPVISDDSILAPSVSGFIVAGVHVFRLTGNDGDDTAFDEMRVVVLSPPFSPCTGGGAAPSADDPEDGPALATSRAPIVWAVLHLDAGDLPVAWMPLADDADYHGGHKQPRILSMGRVKHVASDQFGGLQTSSLDLLVADTDRYYRGRLSTETLTNRELSVWMADDATRRAKGQARRIGHYAITAADPIGDLTFRITAKSFIGSEISGLYSEAKLDVPKYTRAFFGSLPQDLEGLPIPAHFGYIADDNRLPSTDGPVVLDPTLGNGGILDGGLFPDFGWGDIPGAAPVDLTLGEAAGGTFDSTYTAHVMRTAVIGGIESNPYPLSGGSTLAFTGSGKKLTLDGSAVPGATAYRYYISDVTIGHTASPRTFGRMVESATTAAELLGPDDGTPYVVGPPLWAVVVALMTDGTVTVAQRSTTFDTGVAQYEGFVQRMPYATRPVRIGWTTLADVTEYWVFIRGTTGGSGFGTPDSYRTKYVVASDQTYLDFIPGMAGGETVDGLPGFGSQLGGVTLDYVGELPCPDGVTRSAFSGGLGALSEIHDLFGSDGGTPTPLRLKVDDALYGVSVFAAGKAGWFYPTKYVPLVDGTGEELWVTLVFVNSDHAIAIAGADGTVPMTANVCGLCEDSAGTGFVVDSGIRQALLILANFGPSEDGGWRSGPWKEIPERNGVPVYRSSAFEEVRDHYDLLCAWTLGFEGVLPSVFDFLAAVSINLDVRWRENEHGQLVPFRLDVTVVATAAFTDGSRSVLSPTAANIPAHALPMIRPSNYTLVNRITYTYKRNYVRPVTRQTPAEAALLPRDNSASIGWFSGDVPAPDADSRTAHRIWKDERIEFTMHRNGVGPAWVIARLLARWAWPLAGWTWPASLLAMDVAVGSIVELTHHAGIGTSGAIDRRIWVTGKEIDPAMDPAQAGSVDVWVEGEDITDLD